MNPTTAQAIGGSANGVSVNIPYAGSVQSTKNAVVPTTNNPWTSNALQQNIDPYKFGQTAFSQAPAPSVVSNYSAVKKVPEILATTNQYAQKGQTTDANGNVVNSNGTFVPPPAEPAPPATDNSATSNSISNGGYVGEMYYPAGATLPVGNDGKPFPTTATSPSDDAITANIQKAIAQNDAQTASILQTIHSQYDDLKRIQQLNQQGANNGLIMSGVAQTTGGQSGNAMQSLFQEGLSNINRLNDKESAAISAAQVAGQQGNMQLVDKLNTEIGKIREDKVAAATKLQDAAAKANEKLQEEKKQAEKDSAIAELYTSGVQDTASILAELKKQGITATAKDVGDALKNSGVEDINKIANQASQNGAPLDVIAKIGQAKSVAEANQLASGYLKDLLDTDYKKAQIAKIYDDIRQSGIEASTGSSAPQIVAYANEFASTGKVPTGIPKGSFGVISQVAKELPKQHGEIVSTATGVHPAQDTTYADALSNLSSVVQLAQQLKEEDSHRIGGLISGTLGAITGSEAQGRYLSTRQQIVDLLSRARSGAALTEQEVATYENMLPGRFSEPLGIGQNSDVKIQNFVDNITKDMTQKAAAKGWSIYGVSKVKVGDKDYTVGDIIDNGTQKGRVNPDGTITILDGDKQSFNSVGGDTKQATNMQIPTNTLAAKNNNPGNLRFAGQAGASQGKGGFAMFKSAEQGFNALVNQIKLDASRGLTLASFITKYAPPSENDTKQYIQQIAEATSTDPNTKLSQADINKIAKAMAFKESGTKIL